MKPIVEHSKDQLCACPRSVRSRCELNADPSNPLGLGNLEIPSKLGHSMASRKRDVINAHDRIIITTTKRLTRVVHVTQRDAYRARQRR